MNARRGLRSYCAANDEFATRRQPQIAQANSDTLQGYNPSSCESKSAIMGSERKTATCGNLNTVSQHNSAGFLWLRPPGRPMAWV
jgi:hypothetical protein